MEKKLGYTFPLVFLCVLLIPSQASAAKCEDLTKLNLPDVAITSSTSVPGGKFTPPDSSSSLETPEFCRVVAVAKPTSDSMINFEVWIPSGQGWNHNFLGVGNGGYNGAIQYARLADGLKRGFATASTDTGHTGEDLSFGAGHPEKIIDWGYRAIHVMTESAKLIIREYTGDLPKHSYFMGCSTGGHQALSEAQRFPTDYDGIAAVIPEIIGFTSMWDSCGHSLRRVMLAASRFYQAPNFRQSTKQRLQLVMPPMASLMESFPTRRNAISTPEFSSARKKKMSNV